MDLRIANKTALVTGGASGIGKAIVKELLINNVKVYFTSRSKEKIEKFLKEIDLYCNNAQGIVADISQEGEAERIFDEINKSDNIDILVNNVGDTLGILDPYCSLKEWHKLFDLIMGVAIRLNNLSIPIMSKNKWGRIVNITAGAAYENSGPVPYCSFKSAFTAYSRSMARVLALEGNNVVMSSVLPGVVITENGHWQNVLATRPEHAEKYLNERTTLKRSEFRRK